MEGGGPQKRQMPCDSQGSKCSAIHKEEDAFCHAGFHQPEDLIHNRVGLPGSGRHCDQHLALPLAFIPNYGHYDPLMAFAVTGPQSALFFTKNEIVITAVEKNGNDSISHIVRQTFPGSADSPAIEGADLLPRVANYFLGNDPSWWQTNVSTYGSVVYHNLYPDIDLCYKGTEGVLKREFVVAPGADPAAIRLHYEGIDAMRLDDAGALILTIGNSTLKESPVTCYQEVDGSKVIIPAGFSIVGDRDISLSVGTYDPSFPLVIDPALVFSTYLGGSNADTGYDIAVDSSGNMYVTGYMESPDFSTTIPGGGFCYYGSCTDVFVTKLNPGGVYSGSPRNKK
jgi:large repetitive protein